MNVQKLLTEHRAVKITVGQSGADVYEIDEKYVLKHVVRGALPEEQFDAYGREAQFYQAQFDRQPVYLPKMLAAETSEDEILILIKKYAPLRRGALDASMLRKIMGTLAALHTDDLPPFLRRGTELAEPFSDQRIAECVSGWASVLARHPGAFDESVPEKIARRINELILWHDAEERVMAHGDFHWDNLLQDEQGHILLCDWQGVHSGGASGDLSFFLSRLGADGVQLNPAGLTDFYVSAIRERSGRQLDRQAIMRHMSAANVITSFAFWHEYLHGSREERVREIFDKMRMDFEQWLSS
ncbi:MAG: phosphotransferase [Christensenellaceae bacterium]|nr:phosphotransferase [Christensenellaceae bacterium]